VRLNRRCCELASKAEASEFSLIMRHSGGLWRRLKRIRSQQNILGFVKMFLWTLQKSGKSEVALLEFNSYKTIHKPKTCKTNICLQFPTLNSRLPQQVAENGSRWHHGYFLWLGRNVSEDSRHFLCSAKHCVSAFFKTDRFF